jgi:hypothetical protein
MGGAGTHVHERALHILRGVVGRWQMHNALSIRLQTKVSPTTSGSQTFAPDTL